MAWKPACWHRVRRKCVVFPNPRAVVSKRVSCLGRVRFGNSDTVRGGNGTLWNPGGPSQRAAQYLILRI